MKFKIGDFVKCGKYGGRFFEITHIGRFYIRTLPLSSKYSFAYYFHEYEVIHVTKQELHTLKIELAGNKI